MPLPTVWQPDFRTDPVMEPGQNVLAIGPFQARQKFQGDGFELPGAQIGLKGGIDLFPEMA